MTAFFRALGAVLFAVGLAGCDDLRTQGLGIYVLHDISATYFRELARNVGINKALLPQLRARDEMAIAQIIDCSFSDRAVIARADIPDRPSERNTAILGIGRALDQFRDAAKETQFTDIRGALLQAASELQSSRTPRRLIVMFSDLVEDPAPTCRRDRDAPIDLSGISVVAVNVSKLETDNRNPQAYFARLESWRGFVGNNGGTFTVISDPKELAELIRDRG